MKVRLFAILAGVLVILSATAILASTASADGGPHSKRSSVIAGCSSCHRAHTASDPSLLFADQYTLCTSCHGSAGPDPDVIDGVEIGVGPLRGGGFVNAWINSTYSITPSVAISTTSRHAVVGMTGYTNGTVWGNGAINSGAGDTFALMCGTCHDPHGGSSSTGGKTYRILRSDLSDVPSGGTGLDVTDSSTRNYTINDLATDHYYGQLYPVGNDTDTSGADTKINQISNWCAGCHTRIHATGAGTGSTSSGDAIYNFRHRTDGTSVAFNYTKTGTTPTSSLSAPACLTCHVAHGTNALNTYRGNPIQVPLPGTPEGGGQYLDSSLLRLDARGVCEACHNK